LRILLVEDDQSSAEAMRDLLELSGHTVDWSRNGREALERLRSEAGYCVILLDVMMPVMNGYEFRDEQLKDPRLASIPVIVLTADGRAREKAAAPQQPLLSEALLAPGSPSRHRAALPRPAAGRGLGGLVRPLSRAGRRLRPRRTPAGDPLPSRTSARPPR